METILKNFTDPYIRKARLYPAVLTLLPAIAAAAIYTDWLNFDAANAFVIAVGTAMLFWLSNFARHRGKITEDRLLTKWGYFPSVTMLRHHDDLVDQFTTARYHRAAEKLDTEIRMPTEEEEKANPDDSNQKYASVTKLLLSRTRDTKRYPLIFKELANYGFQRNMLGLKWVAIFIAGSTLVSSICLGWSLISIKQLPDQNELLLAMVSFASVVFWYSSVNERAVKTTAISYASRLLEALEDL